MKRLILIISLIVVFSILLISCSIFNSDPRFIHSGYKISAGESAGYKTFRWENDIASFLFEYPKAYKIEKNNTYISTKYNDCIVSLKDSNDTRIDISIFFPDEISPSFTDAKSRVDFILERIERFEGRELIEKSDVIISGIPGILIVSEDIDYVRALAGMYKKMASKSTPSESTTTKSPPKCISREINFDHNNQIWIVSIDSMSSVAEAVKPYFDHLVETFQVLK